MSLNLEEINKELKDKSPAEIIAWAVSFAKNAVITTNFRPYEVAILNAVSEVKKNIKVIWCDTGYNTNETYKHAEEIIEKLNLNIQLYVPKQTAAHRNVVLGIPSIESPKHKVFTEQVKLEPFSRAMKEHQPDVWFTNLRKGQTAFRDNIDIVSLSKDGIIKVSPFYNWTDEELDTYLDEKGLPNEFTYFDPTKVESNRECGLHI
ncbi:phosphoadenosine phosphosulfate reductase family protein [Polaribacter ponticola]|uniref:Phosphoadenosine phosphosulfate reductase family protein n=1 Tax=Polaribacter ponticola TaxID=2978475 RepID=A0ABT5SAX3_9FLAO|nr:phosphoadenosine phosphosulfate reductase family protein [Polaribacter sp. MSW5]MDD7914989.1 phosphoadenosine phosphosulfate reductase family protein [Polaribacter sp. MSW5]